MSATRVGRLALAGAAGVCWGLLAGCSLIPGLGGQPSEQPVLERIAVIPFAYQDGERERACDLCTRAVQMKPTSREDAAFVSAFFFEQLTAYPQLVVSDTQRFERLMDVPMEDALQLFRTMDEVDAVLVGAVVGLRERVGSAEEPKRPAAATLYAELIDARTRRSLWSGTFDREQQAPGRLRATLERVVEGGSPRWHSALSYARQGAAELVSSMMRQAFSS